MLLCHAGVQAQNPASPDPLLWGLCPPDPLAAAVAADTGAPKDAPVSLAADAAQSSETAATLEGNVRVTRGDAYLTAPRVSLDRMADRLYAEEGAVYGDPALAVRSRQAEVDLAEHTAVFGDAEYYLPERNAQGSAARVETDRARRQSRLNDATFSTCERGHEFWQLRSRRLQVNEDTGRGTARDITVAIKGVPVFYFPYLSFPIDDKRHSGFLFPEVRYDNKGGFDLRVPYYWNIAPDRDMTIAPRIFTRRGFMLGAQYRFLTLRDRGAIDVEYLPHDGVRGEARGAVHVEHQANPAPNLYSNALFQYVSDDDYVDDFGNNLDLVSPSYLERRLESTYFGNSWNALLRLQGFQAIDPDVFPTPDARPYSRLPQVLFQGLWPQPASYGLTYDLRGELVNFDHPSLVTGTRLDLLPTVSLPFERPQGYINPRVSYRFTTYSLQDAAADQSNTPSRGAPIVSVDSGLFFERPLDLMGQSVIQTLEPRLFYLYVPFQDQDDIPVFDSTEVDLSYAWLFLDNRFTGADRLGDANQLTTALTTRVLGARDGRERLRASVGQIRYFEDREVTLPDQAPQVHPTASHSPLIAEAVWSMTPELFLRGFVHWDPDESDTQRRGVDLRYHSGDRIFNVAYRFARDDALDQVDVAMLWPFGPRWKGLARWNYSLEQARTIDAIAGFEYNECCWALRMLARSRRDRPEDPDPRNSVLVQLELKGLSGVGQRIDRMLEDIIFGYQRTRY